MMLRSTTLALLLLSYARVIACDDLHARAACSSSYTACSPKGAATTNEPPVGTGVASLFVDVVDTLDSANLAKREADRFHGLIETRASGGSLCCKYMAPNTSMIGADSRSRCRRNPVSSSPGSGASFLLCEHPTAGLTSQLLI